MGSFLSLVLAYVLGGITFLPLLVLAVLGHAYYTLPAVDPAEERRRQDEDLQESPGSPPDLSSLPAELQKPDRERDAAAGYFAICREYVPGGVNGKPPERLTPAGEVIAVESPSVYQSMYRSIFERNKSQGPSFEATGGNIKATKKARNVFYVVLRLGHLMLYDNAEQLEVRHVISLGLYEVDVYGGGEVIPDGELWVRRNCIRLRRRETDYTLRDSKPYFLFSDNCSEKEDFFHALIQNHHRSSTSSQNPVVPLRFEPDHMIKLIQQLHASEELMQTRWFNAILGRVFLSMYKTSQVQEFIHTKITKKLTRIQKPSFIEQIKVGKIDMGNAAPLFTNPRLRELTLDGELVIETDVKYSGNFRLEIAAAVLIDLGKRFNVRRIDILLAGICKSLEGHLLIKIKPPPANRIWISFETNPKLDLSIEPIISSRQITYGIILRTIESKIREVIGETLVFPNWDDIPFSHTERDPVRGGLWDFHASDYVPPTTAPTEPTEPAEGDDVKTEEPTLSKSQSTPSLLRRRPVGAPANGKATSLKTGAESSVSSGRESPSSQSKPKAIRTNSFATASSPIVSMSPTNASAIRDDSPYSLQDAASAMKGLSSRSSSSSSTPPIETQAGGLPVELEEESEAREPEDSDLFDMEMPVDDTPRASQESVKSLRNGSKSSINVEGFGNPQLSDQDKRKKTFVAGAQVATAAARKWGYDFVAKRASQASTNDSTSDLSTTASVQNMPIGRGQPLPPPGQPLPGPPNAFRKSWTTALGNIGRKRVPSGAPSITSLSEEGREVARAAARMSSEAIPPLPPRPSTENTPPVSAPTVTHSRKGSAHSRRSSTRTQRTSVDEHVSDDILVIKAPETSDEQADDAFEKRPLKIVEDGSQQAHGGTVRKTEEHSSEEDESAAGAEGEGEDEDLQTPINNSHHAVEMLAGETPESGLPSTVNEADEASDTKKLDQDSLDLLQTLVH